MNRYNFSYVRPDSDAALLDTDLRPDEISNWQLLESMLIDAMSLITTLQRLVMNPSVSGAPKSSVDVRPRARGVVPRYEL